MNESLATRLCPTCGQFPDGLTHFNAVPRREYERQVTRAVGAERERDELRAILAPLLDDPVVWGWNGKHEHRHCTVCDGFTVHGAQEPFPHEPDCPVLRREALLGREATGG